MSLCRQLTSGLDGESTYLPYRGHLLDSLILQPITILTLYKLPLIGFSLSKTNSLRKSSMFFSAVAKCIMKNNGVFRMEKLNKQLDSNIKNNDLDPILVSLREKIENSQDRKVDVHPCLLDIIRNGVLSGESID